MFSRIMGSFYYKTPKSKVKKQYEPTISFVIPSKDEGPSIYNTMTKCFEVDYDLNKIEIIAINDGSTDNTLEEMRRAAKDIGKGSVKIINWKKNKGKREGMSEGFRRANGEIVIQLDSDSFLERDALKIIVQPMRDKKIAAVVGHTLPANKDENLMTKMQTAYYFMSFRALKATESMFDMVFCCSGCFSAYRKEYVLPVLNKFLNETFMGKKIVFGDDRALTNLMIKEGYKTIYSDEAKAYTIVPTTLKIFLKQQVRWKKGWFINSMRIAKTVLKKDPFVAMTYFFPLIILTLIAPFIALKALVISPILLGFIPIFYIIGIMLVSVLLYAHHEIHAEVEDRKYGKYMIAWSILNMTILSYIMLYALYDLRNMAWGTR
jgi:hyaluronan synthase